MMLSTKTRRRMTVSLAVTLVGTTVLPIVVGAVMF